MKDLTCRPSGGLTFWIWRTYLFWFIILEIPTHNPWLHCLQAYGEAEHNGGECIDRRCLPMAVRKHIKRAGQDITRSQLPSPSEAPSSVVLAALTCSIYSTYGLVRTPGNMSLPEIPSADNQDVSPWTHEGDLRFNLICNLFLCWVCFLGVPE